MNRALRRVVMRGRPGKPRPLCAPGTHAFQAWTVAGVTKRVVCTGCGREFMQVMEESPGDLAIYRQWLAEEINKAEHAHPRDAFAPFVAGCPGCDREKQLLAAAPSQLAAKEIE